MNRIMKWIEGARWRMSLSHCVEALPIQLTASLMAGNNWWIGHTCVFFWYWSRKKLEVEYELAKGGDHVPYWWAGWIGDHWDRYKFLDVLFPMLSSMILAILISGAPHY